MRKHLTEQKIHPQLVVSSPLTRCLETTAGCFGGLYTKKDENGDTQPADQILMIATTALEGKCTQQDKVEMPGVPIVACELCRETFGVCRWHSACSHTVALYVLSCARLQQTSGLTHASADTVADTSTTSMSTAISV